MSEEINKIIDNLEGCIGMFDYLITPVESNLLVSYIKELQQENEKPHHYKTLYQSLKKQNDELKEDISFCLKSIKQEMEMSTDSRSRGEMKSCYEILERWNK